MAPRSGCVRTSGDELMPRSSGGARTRESKEMRFRLRCEIFDVSSQPHSTARCSSFAQALTTFDARGLAPGKTLASKKNWSRSDPQNSQERKWR